MTKEQIQKEAEERYPLNSQLSKYEYIRNSFSQEAWIAARTLAEQEREKELQTLRTQNAAYKMGYDAMEKIKAHAQKEALLNKSAAMTTDSEREMNSILTVELESKDREISQLKQELETFKDGYVERNAKVIRLKADKEELMDFINRCYNGDRLDRDEEREALQLIQKHKS